jgi:hypothetical protein
MVVVVKISVSCGVTPCSLVERYRHFGETYWLLLQNKRIMALFNPSSLHIVLWSTKSLTELSVRDISLGFDSRTVQPVASPGYFSGFKTLNDFFPLFFVSQTYLTISLRF